ncbi:MAG: hypothetical protein EOS20_18475 [Mesorhizobium sp.]|uniref:hypothetical protein n=1 Tax=Mesorhizobium sp. TaxID=1871066 RepID=UPI000FE8C214|nr:hypothetical protein [Mesorhizobium sp.]RWQ35495.1 MAG: hypothetical protein EOS20_18475 [Mesorhizobium sp.]RWQ38693.1 MAG: hypothetical protein EOS21_19325 [Mesorhizobium sp.]
MDTQNRRTQTTASPIPVSLAGKPGHRFSDARRDQHPEHGSGTRHPRAVQLADALREIAGCGEGATDKDMSMLGFSVGEIIAFLPEAKLILAESFVRDIAPIGDRVPQIIEKALASAAHIMPKTAGLDSASEDVAETEWRRYCIARSAFKLDPWWSQSERCLALLKTFLKKLPLLERETNRVLYAIAAAQKADVHRGEHA